MEKENPPRLLGAHQKRAAFIASRGWKSSNSSPLSVEGEVFSLTFPFIELLLSGDSAQNAGQAASSAKNLAKERIVFNLSSLKPRSSSSLTRVSNKSLPNTCVRCEYR
jgi:hypothetical protein